MRIRNLRLKRETLGPNSVLGFRGLLMATSIVPTPYLLEGLASGEWLGIAGLGLAGAAIALVLFNILRNRQGRVAKVFLLDPRGTPLKELVFDPGCPISLPDAQKNLPGRGLEGEEESESAGYRLKTLQADNLRLIIAYRGRLPQDHPTFAKFLMVSVQDNFEDAVKQRLAERLPPTRWRAMAMNSSRVSAFISLMVKCFLGSSACS